MLDADQGPGDPVVSLDHTAKWGEGPLPRGQPQLPHQGCHSEPSVNLF